MKESSLFFGTGTAAREYCVLLLSPTFAVHPLSHVISWRMRLCIIMFMSVTVASRYGLFCVIRFAEKQSMNHWHMASDISRQNSTQNIHYLYYTTKKWISFCKLYSLSDQFAQVGGKIALRFFIFCVQKIFRL